jgi:hypothetical protein
MPFISENKTDLAFREINGKKYWLSNHGVHKIIYPRWNIETFTVGKNTSTVITPRDTWFYNLEDTNELKINWQVGLDKFWKSVPDYWKNDPMRIDRSIKACWSKEYLLEN